MAKSGTQKKVSSFNAYFRNEYKLLMNFWQDFKNSQRHNMLIKKSIIINKAQIEKQYKNYMKTYQ